MDEEPIGPELDRLLAFFARELSWTDRVILRWKGRRCDGAFHGLTGGQKIVLTSSPSVLAKALEAWREAPGFPDEDHAAFGADLLGMCDVAYFVRPHLTLAFYLLSLIHRDRPTGATADEFASFYRFAAPLIRR